MVFLIVIFRLYTYRPSLLNNLYYITQVLYCFTGTHFEKNAVHADYSLPVIRARTSRDVEIFLRRSSYARWLMTWAIVYLYNFVLNMYLENKAGYQFKFYWKQMAVLLAIECAISEALSNYYAIMVPIIYFLFSVGTWYSAKSKTIDHVFEKFVLYLACENWEERKAVISIPEKYWVIRKVAVNCYRSNKLKSERNDT